MGAKPKDKGDRGEHQVIALLQDVVTEMYRVHQLEPPVLKRNLEQRRSGGYDIVGLPWVAVEVKYQEQWSVGAWWRQAVRQAGEEQRAILFYRKNHVPWTVRLFGYIDASGYRFRVPVDLSVNHFKVFFRKDIEGYIRKNLLKS